MVSVVIVSTLMAMAVGSPDHGLMEMAGYSAERMELARSYHAAVAPTKWVFAIAPIVIYAFIAATGWGGRLGRRLERRLPSPLAVVLVWLLVGLAAWLVLLPMLIYRGFLVEHVYGFSSLTFGEWVLRSFGARLVYIAVAAIPLLLFHLTWTRIKRWWLTASLASGPLIVGGIVLAPLLVDPIFSSFSSLRDGPVRTQAETMANAAGIPDATLLEIDVSARSTRLNAYVTGLWGSSRIVLYDNLIEHLAPGEVAWVLAHEIGHYTRHHLWIGALSAWLITAGALSVFVRVVPGIAYRWRERLKIDSIRSAGAVPLIMTFVAASLFVTQPVAMAISRGIEVNADHYAAMFPGLDRSDGIAAVGRLADFNLGDPDPHPLTHTWFGSHPTLQQRLSVLATEVER